MKEDENVKIIDFLSSIFGNKSTIDVSKARSEYAGFAVEKFATDMAVNMIAGIISKCEFKTYMNGKPVKKDDYYLWNVQPNVNQNANEFWQEVVSKLLKRNECLIVDIGGDKIIADTYDHDEKYVIYPDTFRSVTRKDICFEKCFNGNEVIFLKLNNEDIRAAMSGVLSEYSDLLGMAKGKYKRSGGRKGVFKSDRTASGDSKENEKTTELINKQFSNYFNSENAVLSLTKGTSYEEISGEGSKKSTSEVQDITNLMNGAIARAAQAFRIPPAILQGDIADVDKIVNELLTFCIEPICRLIETEVNRKNYSKEQYLTGNFVKVDTTCVKHIDVFEIAVQADKLISSGIYSIDDLLEKIGEPRINESWSKNHWITKNYESIDSAAKGGEMNEE